MSYDVLMQQALKLHQEGQLDAAEALYRQILDTSPEHPAVLNLLGLIAQSKGLDNQAVELFSKAIGHSPNSADAYFNLAWSLQNLRKDAEAIETYQRALLLQPGVKEAYNALANLYARNEQPDKAEQAYRQAISLDGDYAEAYANLAHLHRDLPQLLELAKRYPQEALIPYYISLHYQQANDIPSAVKFAQTADKLANDEKIKLLLAELHLANGNDRETARQYYEEALLLNPKSVPALINLANTEIDDTRREAMYKQALDIAPQDLDAHLNYADMLYHQNRLHEALEEYRAAVILNPDKPEISNNLGIIQRDFGEFEEALGLFFNAFAKAPQTKEYALNIAETLTLLSEKDAAKATKIAENWLKNAPDNPFARHINAAMRNQKNINPAEYSRQLFDLFAENYDTAMAKIDYRVPEAIAEAIAPAEGTIVDLGCGTGLTGAAVKNNNNRLIGADISPQMLAKAKARNVYEQLVETNIEEWELPAADWVVAADVFGYVGNVANIIKRCYPRSLCFSAATGAEKDFELMPNGRYRHHPDYIRRLLEQAGYTDIADKDIVLRQENGSGVNGKIFTAKR